MKTKSITLFIFTAISLLLCNSNIAKAQIIYNNDGINIRNAPSFGSLDLLIKLNGMYWSIDKNRFFQLDVTPMHPRLAGSNNKVVFYNTVTSTYNDIQVAGVFNMSDSKAKTDIKSIESGLDAVLNLNPISYHWKGADNAHTATIFANHDTIPAAYGPDSFTTQYGFLAQEVEQVLPDVVKTDETGNKLVNYIALIPMLVQSIQELHAIVEQQTTIIENMNASKNITARIHQLQTAS